MLAGGCKPKLDSEDPQERQTAVERIQDQAVLAELAGEAVYPDVRQAAVTKLTDQDVLAWIAMKNKDQNVRKAAVERLTNQVILAKVAVDDWALDVCKAAAENLTDQVLLAKVAAEAKYLEVRGVAMAKVTDQRFLVKWAAETKDTDFRSTIVRRITDQVALAKLATEDEDARVRAFAVRILTDQTVLSKAALQDKNEEVRLAAVSRLSDQAVLLKVAVEQPDMREYVWQCLIRQMERDGRKWVALYGTVSPDPDIRRAAVQEVRDQVVLARLARERCHDVSAAAVSRIDEIGLLLILAGDLLRPAHDMVESISRIKLASRERPITDRIGEIQIEVVGEDISRLYEMKHTGEPVWLHTATIGGEKITMGLTTAGKTLATASWSTVFPDTTSAVVGKIRSGHWGSNVDWDHFLSASVHAENLLVGLFSLSVFTPDDLRELTKSKVPEVRQGAIEALKTREGE